jgi:DNA-binding transcriptional LysR family regulator
MARSLGFRLTRDGWQETTMDRFKQIETFVRVADAGSLAAAALEEGVSPVILGRRIDALEKRLGVKLMYRSTRRLVVSEEGAAFLERCRGLLTDWDQAENELSAGRRAVNGHLIVSAPAAFGRKHVAPLAPDFLADKPGLQLSFNLTDRVVDLVREGYDLSIRIGGAVDPNFVAVKLASNRRVVCGTPDYFRKFGKPKTLEDLPQHNCLAFNLQGGQNRGWYFRRNGKLATVRVGGTLDCNDGELLHRWVSEGLGLGWRSTWEIQQQLARGELETVLDEFALPDYDILAVYPQQRYVPAKVRYFIDYLKEVYASEDYWNRPAY